MKESDLNRIITNSVNDIGFAYKIPDPSKTIAASGSTVKRPFDIFCVNPFFTAYIESKMLKGYKAFNFKHIREHQLKSLLDIRYSVPKQYLKYVFSLIAVGVWESRKYFDVYFFDINAIKILIDFGIKSILKKEFKALKESNKYLEIHKNKIVGLSNLKNKIIGQNELTNIIREIYDGN